MNSASGGVKWATPIGLPKHVRVSSDGRVFLKERVVPRGQGQMRLRGKELKVKKYQGYDLVQFRLGGKNKAYRVHRLVLMAHSGEAGEGMDCNHKNGVRDDNRIENLEWCTRSENHKHAYRVLGRRPAMKGRESANKGLFNNTRTSKPIVGVCLDTGERVRFDSANEAGRNGFSRDGIAHCLIGSQKTSGGYRWVYADGGGKGE
jgi:hypothetical protein